MLEIGTEFEWDWEPDAGGYYEEMVAVHGYVYYDGQLYYTCVGPSGVVVDVHKTSAENQCG